MPRLLQTMAWGAVLAAAALLAPTAAAQIGRTYPGQAYFVAVDTLHDADYRRAERAFRSELRGSVRTINQRWLDAAMFRAMLGESLLQQGRLVEALEQFDAAIDQWLVEPRWLGRLDLGRPVRRDASLARRMPAWARGLGDGVFADVPDTFNYRYGQVNQADVLARGGVVQMAQLWRLDAQELARAIAWTLYRRGELLGPLGAYDRRGDAVLSNLTSGAGEPAGHWTSVWTSLWAGLAHGARGDALQAGPRLEQAVTLGGATHRLSGVARLALGRLTAATGEPADAARHYQAALYAAIAYDDAAVATEAVRAWHELAQATAKAPSPPLAEVIAWASRSGYAHTAIAASLARLEAVGSVGGAIEDADIQRLFARRRDAASGLLGVEGARLRAWSATRWASLADARGLAAEAVTAASATSLRRLQERVAVAWAGDGRLSPRNGRKAFAAVLSDPAPFHWQSAPAEAIAALADPATDAFDLWFAAALDIRDPMLAARVIDQQRRRELAAVSPLGGRPTAVRWLLERTPTEPPPIVTESRKRLERRDPGYVTQRREGAAASAALRTAIEEAAAEGAPPPRRAVAEFAATLVARERSILRAALGRTPTPLVYPPPIDPAAAKQRYEVGEAVVVFHEAGGELHGVVLTRKGEHLWRVGPTAQVRTLTERLLAEVAGKGGRQPIDAEWIASDAWEPIAAQLGQLLLGGSRLDPKTITRLRVVPDGAVWRAPLELLPLGGGADARRLGDFPLTVAPTPGWATRVRDQPATDQRSPRRVVIGPKVGVVSRREAESLIAGPLRAAGVDPIVDRSLTALPLVKATADGAVARIEAPLRRASEGRLEIGAGGAERGGLAAWSRLPIDGPRSLAVVGLVGGDAGGAGPSRARVTAGAPELHAVGGLLAGGVRDLLIERWPSGGDAAERFVAEWLLGVEQMPADEAWRRARDLGRATPIEPQREPRLDADSFAVGGEPPAAEHPFWWAGYLPID
ncbi:MAG: hypothetical protein AAF805_04320 [Planctomycetota bacterium]